MCDRINATPGMAEKEIQERKKKFHSSSHPLHCALDGCLDFTKLCGTEKANNENNTPYKFSGPRELMSFKIFLTPLEIFSQSRSSRWWFFFLPPSARLKSSSTHFMGLNNSTWKTFNRSIIGLCQWFSRNIKIIVRKTFWICLFPRIGSKRKRLYAQLGSPSRCVITLMHGKSHNCFLRLTGERWSSE